MILINYNELINNNIPITQTLHIKRVVELNVSNKFMGSIRIASIIHNIRKNCLQSDRKRDTVENMRGAGMYH